MPEHVGSPGWLLGAARAVRRLLAVRARLAVSLHMIFGKH